MPNVLTWPRGHGNSWSVVRSLAAVEKSRMNSRTCLTPRGPLASHLHGHVTARPERLERMAPETLIHVGAAVCAISPADVESNLKDFRAGLPMNLLRIHLSHYSVVGQSCRVCLLARRGSRWMANTKVDNAICPYYYSWLEACAPGGGPA